MFISTLDITDFHLDPLSPTSLINIDEEGFQCVLKTLIKDEYVKHDFDDCLRPEYTIPGLITHIIHVAKAAIVLSYWPPSSGGKQDWRLVGPTKYLSISDTTLLLYQNRSNAYMRFVALPKMIRMFLFLSFLSLVQNPSEARSRLHFQVRSWPSILDKLMTPVIAAISPCPSTSRDVHSATRFDAYMSRRGATADSSLETMILLLFHAMSNRIPKALFDRAICSQRRIDMRGELYEVTPQDAGVDQDLARLLDGTTLGQIINHLVSLALIKLEDTAYVCQDESTRILFEQSRDYWIRQAFILSCYVFPRGPSIDPLWVDNVTCSHLVKSLKLSRFSSGRELLGALLHILRLYAESGLEPPPGNNTVETLLSASKFVGPSDKERLLMMAARLQTDPEEVHMRAKVVHQLSIMFRSTGRISDSERVIKEFFSSQSWDSNQKFYYFLGLLHLSQANNQAYRFKFREAREETCKWQPSGDTLSGCELRLLCDQLCTSGRIIKGESQFDEARRCFEGCLATPELPKSKRLLIISHLSDVYCEIDYVKRNNTCQLALQSEYLNKGSVRLNLSDLWMDEF